MRRSAIAIALTVLSLFLVTGCKREKQRNYEPRAIPSGSAACAAPCFPTQT